MRPTWLSFSMFISFSPSKPVSTFVSISVRAARACASGLPEPAPARLSASPSPTGEFPAFPRARGSFPRPRPEAPPARYPFECCPGGRPPGSHPAEIAATGTRDSWSESTASPGSINSACSERTSQASPGSQERVSTRFLASAEIRSSGGSERGGNVVSIFSSPWRTASRRTSSRVAKWRNSAPVVSFTSWARFAVVSAVTPWRPTIRRAASPICWRLSAPGFRIRTAIVLVL